MLQNIYDVWCTIPSMDLSRVSYTMARRKKREAIAVLRTIEEAESREREEQE